MLQEYPGPPYYLGAVYSDGPVWVTVASTILGVPLDNWAVSSASSGAYPSNPTSLDPPFGGLTEAVDVPAPSAIEQVAFHA